jgi:uncharacterized protein
MPFDHVIPTPDELYETYAEPGDGVRTKAVATFDEHCRAYIARSPFVLVATVDSEGRCDVSPRGGDAGFVTVLDDTRLVIPDASGNNRLDTLRNIVTDPRVGLIFLVPGVGEELRVRGTAVVSTDPVELSRHEMRGSLPASVLVVTVERVYFQCARAIKRSRLWDEAAHVDADTVPSAGQMTREAGGFGSDDEAAAYDRALDARQEATLY